MVWAVTNLTAGCSPGTQWLLFRNTVEKIQKLPRDGQRLIKVNIVRGFFLLFGSIVTWMAYDKYKAEK